MEWAQAQDDKEEKGEEAEEEGQVENDGEALFQLKQ